MPIQVKIDDKKLSEKLGVYAPFIITTIENLLKSILSQPLYVDFIHSKKLIVKINMEDADDGAEYDPEDK